MVAFKELDEGVPFFQQLTEEVAPVMFFNTFHVAPEDVDDFLAAWTRDGEYIREQPGYISTQLHRGIGGSTTFINVAVWESVDAMRNAVSTEEFQASLQAYPSSSVASPHLFTKVAVPGICDG